jgi:hypothetical protein
MNAKINQHGSTPSDLQSPVYRHSSETLRSPLDSGGKIDRSSYEGKTPRPSWSPALSDQPGSKKPE